MSTRRAEPVFRRMLIALDATAQGRMALEATAAFAAHLQTELAGVFVEDINLLRLAGLPFAREVGLPSAAVRRLELLDVERALRAQAAQAEAVLSGTAQRLGLSWSFRVVRGELVGALLAQAEESDVLVLRSVHRRITRALRLEAGGGLPRPDCLRRPVLAVFEGTPACPRALSLAARLAALQRTGLVAVVRAGTDEAASALAEAAAAQLRREGAEARFHRLVAAGDGERLVGALRAGGGGTVVIAAGSPLLEGPAARRWLERTECPVLLVP